MHNANHDAENREARYATIARIGAIVCVTFVIVAATFHHPAVVDEATLLDTAVTAPVPAPTSTSRADSNGYYMPSQYDEAHVPADNADASPTF